MRRERLAAVLITAAVVLAGCGSGSAPATSTGTTSTSSPSTATSSAPSGSATTSAPAARNLVVSTALRGQLVAAGAAMHQLSSSDYTGLVKGQTYYAYVPATGTYWAGAALVASRKSMRAQVGDQDDGAYLDFERQGNGPWKAYPAGVPGSSEYACAVRIPPAVLAVWGWPGGTCNPPAGTG